MVFIIFLDIVQKFLDQKLLKLLQELWISSNIVRFSVLIRFFGALFIYYIYVNKLFSLEQSLSGKKPLSETKVLQEKVIFIEMLHRQKHLGHSCCL